MACANVVIWLDVVNNSVTLDNLLPVIYEKRQFRLCIRRDFNLILYVYRHM